MWIESSTNTQENFVIAYQWDWPNYVGLAKFGYNEAMHLATKESHIIVAYTMDPLQPANPTFEVAHLTLVFNQDGED